MRSITAALGVGISALLGVLPASADSLDPALSRLVLNPECHRQQNNGQFSSVGVFQQDSPQYWQADNAAFTKLVNQWGFVLAPNTMHSARSTGYGGFHFSFQGAFTTINDGADYWTQGTQGVRDPTSNAASIVGDPPGMIQVYSAKIRKNFGFGMEGTTGVGFLPNTSIIMGGADARISLLEGFRTGIGGILPDIMGGGSIRTITGTPEFQLTTVGLDASISKPLTIADSAIITPFIGYQYLWIFGDSGLIDATPATDPVGYCGFTGTDVPGNASPVEGDAKNGKNWYSGQPVCAGGEPSDFNNNIVFRPARLQRQRLLFGLNYRYEMVMVGGEFIMDMVDPADAQTDKKNQEFLKGEPRQWTMAFSVGVMF